MKFTCKGCDCTVKVQTFKDIMNCRKFCVYCITIGVRKQYEIKNTKRIRIKIKKDKAENRICLMCGGAIKSTHAFTCSDVCKERRIKETAVIRRAMKKILIEKENK